MSHLRTTALAVVTSCLFLSQSLTAQDPVKVSPDHYKVLLENESVRVLEMTMAPGESDARHSHPAESVYFVNGGKAKITLPNGESMEKEVPNGGVMWHEAWTHQVANVGKTEIRAIIVESKAAMNGKALDGSEWLIGKKGSKKADLLVFGEGKFTSTACIPYGFYSGAYDASIQAGATSWKAAQKNGKGEMMEWSGAVKDGKMEGQYIWTTKKGKKKTESWTAVQP